jgi:hypothetical protein
MMKDEWFNGVLDALNTMVQRTCPLMRSIWFAATERQRRHWLGNHVYELPADVRAPKNWNDMAKSSRTKYGQLAVWRHAVVWRLPNLLVKTDPEFQEMTAIWFSAYPKDTPPFAWSAKPTEAPNTDRAVAARRELAAQGCMCSLKSLKMLMNTRPADGEAVDWREEDLLGSATRPSLRDVLKLDDSLGRSKVDAELETR